MKGYVEVYKQVRYLQSQPAYFPLDQPRDLGDWDVVLYGDGRGEAQLLYAFRMSGPEQVFIGDLPGEGEWQPLLAADTARLDVAADGYSLLLEPYGSALWKRQR